MATRLEQRIWRDLLSEKIELEEAQKALADPQAWKTQEKGIRYMGKTKLSWRYWRRVKTPRLTIRFCWYVHRNVSGYFLGWRETVDSKGKVTRDQIVARRCKRRLKELMKRKTEALEVKFPPVKRVRKKTTPKALDPRIESIEGSTGDWFVTLKDGYHYFESHSFYIEDKRSLGKWMKEVETCECEECEGEN